MTQRLFCFTGGEIGTWRVTEMNTIIGEPLDKVKSINVINGDARLPQGAAWLLRGIASNDRYVLRVEKDRLVANQPGLGRPEATCAAPGSWPRCSRLARPAYLASSPRSSFRHGTPSA